MAVLGENKDRAECFIPTFGELTIDQINHINKNSYTVKHKKDEIIFKQNTPISSIHFVKSGLIKLFKEGENEKQFILKITTSESFVGILSSFYENTYEYSATSLEPSELVYINLNAFKEVIAENGKYALCLMKVLSTDAISLMDKIITVSQKQVTGRLADVLLFFSTKIYHQNSFTLPVSRQELAEIISSTKESISRTLTEFKNDKIINIEDKRIILNSPELLQILAKLG